MALKKTVMVILFAAFCGVHSLRLAKAERLRILPPDIALHGPDAFQHVILERVTDGQYTGHVTGDVQWQTSDAGIAVFEHGRLVPRGDGKATITARIGDAEATATLSVQGFPETMPWEFRRHVLPVISKIGCNTGACHGALAGKGGFKLSLRGYDPAGDHVAITLEARGRRVEFADPGRSLLLAKPTGALPHQGGLRLETDSRDYQILAAWISQGAPGPYRGDPTLLSVQVLPDAVQLKPGDRQPLIVRASYDDHRVEDVTSWARYSSTDESVAEVDQQGVVHIVGRGQCAIVVWFSSRIELAKITVPYANEIASDAYLQARRVNLIDDLVLANLERLRVAPSPPCDDATFIRRLFLDTVGLIPTAEQTTKFLADPFPDKRDRLIDQLLSSREYVDYWTYLWSDVLLINGKRLRPPAVKAYYQWIRGHVADNTRWDRIVREIVTAKGSSYEHGATNFYALHQTPEDMAENVSQAFLGLSIGCAKCHNHPLEKWTNDQYYAMANLFARVRAKGWGGEGRGGDGLRTVLVADRGDLTQPLRGKPQPPAPLDGEPLAMHDPGDRREHLARWLTAAENPYFSRSIANRVWANFFGIGLVEPVDDLRVSNPASNERLLSALAAYLVEHEYDLKSLMRLILRSATYQTSSASVAENEDDRRSFARYYPRRLMAEVLLDSISQVTEVPTEFKTIQYDGADVESTDEYPLGTRAIQLYDSAVASQFLRTFGRHNREIVCACERTNQPSMTQVLHLCNGVTINEKLRLEGSCVDHVLQHAFAPDAIVTDAYLRTLSRFPTQEERDKLSEMLADLEETERREALEDLYWSLMSSREFLFHH